MEIKIIKHWEGYEEKYKRELKVVPLYFALGFFVWIIFNFFLSSNTDNIFLLNILLAYGKILLSAFFFTKGFILKYKHYEAYHFEKLLEKGHLDKMILRHGNIVLFIKNQNGEIVQKEMKVKEKWDTTGKETRPYFDVETMTLWEPFDPTLSKNLGC